MSQIIRTPIIGELVGSDEEVMKELAEVQAVEAEEEEEAQADKYVETGPYIPRGTRRHKVKLS